MKSVADQQVTTSVDLKTSVRDFWDAASCGEVYAVGDDPCARLRTHARARYALEPYIFEFARFAEGAERDVLEIGVGMGADHNEWAKVGPKTLSGIDLTPRAVDHTRTRLACDGFSSNLRVGDAENLPYGDGSFDIVYSCGVLHHSPDTARAVREVYRVLRPGGSARIAIYHKWSIVGAMLWARYALLTGRWTRSLADVYAQHLESPGTKAFSISDARAMFAEFTDVQIRTHLGFGDLLQGEVGQRHGGVLLRVAKAVWPRWFIRRALSGYGLGLLIEAKK